MVDDLEHIKDMEHAIRYMNRFVRFEMRDVRHLSKDTRREEKHEKKHDENAEAKDVKHIEKDIYEFLLHNIRVMNALIKVEKDEDFVEKHHHIKNPFKEKISREVSVLIQELRRVGVLDRKTE